MRPWEAPCNSLKWKSDRISEQSNKRELMVTWSPQNPPRGTWELIPTWLTAVRSATAAQGFRWIIFSISRGSMNYPLIWCGNTEVVTLDCLHRGLCGFAKFSNQSCFCLAGSVVLLWVADAAVESGSLLERTQCIKEERKFTKKQ